MFVNETVFDRYAKDSGASLSDLETWEGVFRLAADYTKWTDAQTPDIEGDGKPFFVHDYHFNYFQVGSGVFRRIFLYRMMEQDWLLDRPLNRCGNLMPVQRCREESGFREDMLQNHCVLGMRSCQWHRLPAFCIILIR